MKHMLVIVDYGMGNLRSIQHKLGQIGIDATISNDLTVVDQASMLLLPGVGHFAHAMYNLKKLQLISVLNRKVLEERTPVMGICLGMQLLTSYSEEGDVAGLGWIEGGAYRFQFHDHCSSLRIPHVGWNTLYVKIKSSLLKGVLPDQRFYFTHSYAVQCRSEEDVLTTTEYGYEFVSSMQRKHIFGTQFHPEKSHRRGIEVIRNFVETMSC